MDGFSLNQLKRYRRRPQSWWDWWRTDGNQNVNVMRLAKKFWETPLPNQVNGQPAARTLKITTESVPIMAWTCPVNTLSIGHDVMVMKGELPPTSSVSQSTVLLRGDGVVDGWTKVYHLSWLIGEVKRPRSPDNCMDFLLGNIDEGNPIHWGIVSQRLLPAINHVRAAAADVITVGDGAFLFAVERGFTHANTALGAFNQPGVAGL